MSDRIGETITLWRHRRGGMSQTTLAGLAGISQAYLSQIETGIKPLDRKSTQVRIARALNISVAQLTGLPAAPVDPVREQALVHVPAIRVCLVELAAGEIRPPARDPEQLRGAVRAITEHRNAADYAALTPLVPGVLSDLAGHKETLVPQYVETLFATRYALKCMGHPDLAREAADLGLRAAQAHGDPAWLGQAVYSWVQAFPAESAELGAKLTSRAADNMQGHSDRNEQEMYGCLHVLAAYQAAIAQRPADADSHLIEAADIADVLGEPARTGKLSAGMNGNWFSPSQVQIWRMAIAAELGDTGTALALAETVDLDSIPLPNRHVYYFTDFARALAADNRDREALAVLAKAERAAPQHFRFNPVVRDLIATIIHRAKRRSVAGELSDMARALGINPI